MQDEEANLVIASRYLQPAACETEELTRGSAGVAGALTYEQRADPAAVSTAAACQLGTEPHPCCSILCSTVGSHAFHFRLHDPAVKHGWRGDNYVCCLHQKSSSSSLINSKIYMVWKQQDIKNIRPCGVVLHVCS